VPDAPAIKCEHRPSANRKAACGCSWRNQEPCRMASVSSSWRKAMPEKRIEKEARRVAEGGEADRQSQHPGDQRTPEKIIGQVKYADNEAAGTDEPKPLCRNQRPSSIKANAVFKTTTIRRIWARGPRTQNEACSISRTKRAILRNRSQRDDLPNVASAAAADSMTAPRTKKPGALGHRAFRSRCCLNGALR